MLAEGLRGPRRAVTKHCASRGRERGYRSAPRPPASPKLPAQRGFHGPRKGPSRMGACLAPHQTPSCWESRAGQGSPAGPRSAAPAPRRPDSPDMLIDFSGRRGARLPLQTDRAEHRASQTPALSQGLWRVPLENGSVEPERSRPPSGQPYSEPLPGWPFLPIAKIY